MKIRFAEDDALMTADHRSDLPYREYAIGKYGIGHEVSYQELLGPDRLGRGGDQRPPRAG